MFNIHNKSLATWLGLSVFFLALAGTLGFSSLPAAGLPPRPVPTATPAPKAISGAKIMLQTEGLPVGSTGVWTAVQWQDPNTGLWHLVEGWQGTLDLDGSQTWWVGAEILGKGPFRWVIYAEKEGEELAVSSSFNLPEKSGQTRQIEISVD